MNNIAIKHLNKVLEEEYNNDDGFTYADNFSKSEFIEYEIKDFLEHYKDYMYRQIIEVFFSLTWYSLDRLVYIFRGQELNLKYDTIVLQNIVWKIEEQQWHEDHA